MTDSIPFGYDDRSFEMWRAGATTMKRRAVLRSNRRRSEKEKRREEKGIDAALCSRTTDDERRTTNRRLRTRRTLRHITPHHTTLHYITLHCIALHCITLHRTGAREPGEPRRRARGHGARRAVAPRLVRPAPSQVTNTVQACNGTECDDANATRGVARPPLVVCARGDDSSRTCSCRDGSVSHLRTGHCLHGDARLSNADMVGWVLPLLGVLECQLSHDNGRVTRPHHRPRRRRRTGPRPSSALRWPPRRRPPARSPGRQPPNADVVVF